MFSAAVPLSMIVMIAASIRIKLQSACREGFRRFVCAAFYAAEYLDTGLCQRVLRTAADTSTDERIDLPSLQETGQRAMAHALVSNYLCIYDFSILDFVNLKLLRMTKMLKYLSVFVSYCQFHVVCSLFCSFSMHWMPAILYIVRISDLIPIIRTF